MSVFGVLNRAYHNNKASIPWDHGRGLDPIGKIVGTYYTMVARVKKATKFSSQVGGRLVLINLEDHPYPPGDPTQATDSTKQNPVGLWEGGASTAPSGMGDRIAISGTQNFDGEHEISHLDFLPGFKSDKSLLLVDSINPPNLPAFTDDDADVVENDTGWCYIAKLSSTEAKLMDPARVMSHPSFPQREGEGIYTYPHRPDITRNFIYHPATKMDGSMQRTLSSNIFSMRPQLEEDVVISEIWLGGDRQLSALTEMFRVFFQYWTTLPPAGGVMGWEPRDRTGDRFGVQLVRVQLGGLDLEYNEVRQISSQNQDSYLDRQLTVQFKLARQIKPSRPQISLEGR